MHILKPFSSKSKLNILFPLEATNLFLFVCLFFSLQNGVLSLVKKNKTVLFTCLMLEKREREDRNRLAVARMTEPWMKSRPKGFLPCTPRPHPAPPALQVALKEQKPLSSELGGWSSESHLLCSQSLGPRRQITATLWPSGYFWKDSRNFFKSNDLTAKDPDKKSFLDLGAGCRSREWLLGRSTDTAACSNASFVRGGVLGTPATLLSQALVTHQCHRRRGRTQPSLPQLFLFIPTGATLSCLVQPTFPYKSTNLFCLE